MGHTPAFAEHQAGKRRTKPKAVLLLIILASWAIFAAPKQVLLICASTEMMALIFANATKQVGGKTCQSDPPYAALPQPIHVLCRILVATFLMLGILVHIWEAANMPALATKKVGAVLLS